jgi:hypothetical protein
VNINIIKLLKFCFQFVIKYITINKINITKIPYILIEDIIDILTIDKIKTIWNLIIHNLYIYIIHQNIFLKGKLTILKISNSVLKKLSKSCHTEFRGKILMFLASIYPLSEKSGLNLPGKINNSNTTYYEDQETFLKNQSIDNENINHDVSTVSDNAHDKSYNTTTVDLSKHPLTYDLYKSFWSLQSFFTSDHHQRMLDLSINNNDNSSNNTNNNSSNKNNELWNSFLQHCHTVMMIFESSSSASSSSSTTTTITDHPNHTNDQYLDYRGCKYLTSSQVRYSHTLQLHYIHMQP